MHSHRIITTFPPAEDRQVTLANWRQHPFSTWAFRNVRELLPTANIARAQAGSAVLHAASAAGATTSAPPPRSLREISTIRTYLCTNLKMIFRVESTESRCRPVSLEA